MILSENQFVNVCVRALIFEQNQLVMTETNHNPSGFLIGGRVDFGEPLISALEREVEEETGQKPEVQRLLYFCEQLFVLPDGRYFHEYGWYFLVHLPQEVCPNNKVIPNPDAADLSIRRVPLTAEGIGHLWPLFLREYLVQDYADGFPGNPRYLYHRLSQPSVDFTRYYRP